MEQEIDCVEFQKLLENYENLSAKEKQQLSEHTSHCEKCERELSDYFNMIEAVKSLPKLNAPADFLENLNYRIDKENIEQEKKPGAWMRFKQNSYRYSAIVACMAIIAVIGVNAPGLVDKITGNGGTDEVPVISDIRKTPEPSKKPQASPTQTVMPTPSTAPASAAPTVKPLATAIPKSMANQSKSTTKPVSANTQSASDYTTRTTPTLSPTAPSEPDKAYETGTHNTADAETTAKPENAPSEQSDNTSVAANAEVNNVSTQNPNLDPSAYSLPEEDTKSLAVRLAGGGSAKGANTIEVSSVDAERAREIISAYSVANGDETYSIDAEQIDEFVQAMNEAGISVDIGDTDADTVTFRLVIS